MIVAKRREKRKSETRIGRPSACAKASSVVPDALALYNVERMLTEVARDL
jgi:hypothetical protein